MSWQEDAARYGPTVRDLLADAAGKPDVALLDRIDEVTAERCHQCDGPLAGSVSDWFCTAECQAEWTAHQNDVRELTGYVEPVGGWYSDAYSTSDPWPGESARLNSMAPVGSGWTHVWLTDPLRFDASSADWTATFQTVCDHIATSYEPAVYIASPGRVIVPALRHTNPLPDRLDLSWLDHYVPALDDPRDHEEDARREIGPPPNVAATARRAGLDLYAASYDRDGTLSPEITSMRFPPDALSVQMA